MNLCWILRIVSLVVTVKFVFRILASVGFLESCAYRNVDVTDDPSATSCNFLFSFDMMSDPNFIWGDVNSESFVHGVTCCYDEIIHWRKVLFKIPQSKCGS